MPKTKAGSPGGPSDEERLGEYETMAAQSHLWHQTARDFVCAANYLLGWYEPTQDDDDDDFGRDLQWSHRGNAPIMVLYATAVENLLKAVLVAQGAAVVAKGSLRQYFKSHNLPRYAQDAGLAPTADERSLLETLHDMMVAGRYPVPAAPGESVGAWTFDYPRDVARVWQMLDRLEQALRATGKPCLPIIDLRGHCNPSAASRARVSRRRMSGVGQHEPVRSLASPMNPKLLERVKLPVKRPASMAE